jgi:hypothetical protein
MLNYPPLRTFEHKYFYSMIDDDPQSIPDFFASNIENFIIRDRGVLEMRDGLNPQGAIPNKTNLGRAILNNANGTKLMIRVIDGAANTAKFQKSSDGATWTDCTGGGSKATGVMWAMVQANDVLYGVNGTDNPIKFDGTTVSDVVAIPQGTAIEWYKNYLWIFGNPTYKDRLYYSTASTPETFGGSDYINVNLGDVSQGVGLRGSAGESGRLYIGKQKSIWYLTGAATATFAIQPLTYEHGVASHESMFQVKNDVWCVDPEGNIRGLYRTTTDNPFSKLVSKDLNYTTSGLNKAALSKSSAVFFNNFAFIFVPYGVDDYNSLTLVFDTLANEGKGGWVKFTNWNIAGGLVFNESSTPKLYLFDSRNNNGQTYLWNGTSDNGQEITAKYETKIYDFGVPERTKRFKYSYQFAAAQGDFASRFYSSIDRYYYVLLASPSLLGTGNKLLGQTWTLGTDKLGSGGFVKIQIPFGSNGGSTEGSTMQVKLECVSSTVKMKIREFTSHYLVKGLR